MKKPFLLVSTLFILSTSSAFANQTLSIEAKGGRFSPTTLSASANQPIEITVTNKNNREVEIENKLLDVDIDIHPHTTQKIVLSPLQAGEYLFFDDENPTAQTTLIIK